ncbi:MAG: UDP-N-acetylmuramoyl-L-alanyl-D-glutamate--2,6-diaminopimelate ligase [Gammaproteobacteria bacterium]|nr:UDP-N-acetylmuramoyl-L-alanyl-D-glutamate--2,6-diaminopimelate ligase [Gammaproteobacteria bacterium]
MTAVMTRISGVRLSELLAGIAVVPAGCDPTVTDLVADHRDVRPGACFLALPGASHDGAAFSNAAAAAGAAAIVTESAVADLPAGVAVLRVERLRERVAVIAARFFGEPARALELVGVTGTNGKTTVTHLVANALARCDRAPACAVIGTLGYGRPGRLTPTGMTTPEPVMLQRILAELRDTGFQAAVLEVSSHALAQARVQGIAFRTAVFTNLSRDHLDYHESFAAYAEAKAGLFLQPGLRYAVLNLDDAYARGLLDRVSPTVTAIGYTMNAHLIEPLPAICVRGRLLESSAAGTRMQVVSGQATVDLESPLVGRFNAANLLAAVATLLSFDVPLASAAAALARVQGAPGRLERFGGSGNDPLVLVDYAHTPDALEQALSAARLLGDGGLWCVFGCGGDRDRGKRAQMGAIASALADHVLLTNDNPRTESPGRILDEIAAGVVSPPGCMREPDRERAIRTAIAAAGAGDVVLVAGKGHEDYQQIGTQRFAFSDRAVVLAALRAGRA